MCTKDKRVHQHIIKSLIKDHPSTVYDSLLGNALANKNLVVLEDHCIIMRRDHRSMKGKVKIIGGGGAGIEPAESYYVGKGMLSAAVVGEIFSAPSANEILVAIRELAENNSNDILLLVKNYMGDKLNFKLAMEQALSEKIKIKMLVISDDIFPHHPARHGRKGMAGSVLVYKILGEMAEQGKYLEEIIEEYYELIAKDLVTAGISMTPCTNLTCIYLNHYLGSQKMVLGMGIYGKGGAKTVEGINLKNAVSLVLEQIIPSLKFTGSQNEIVVLINNFGAITKVEEAVIAKEVAMQLNNLEFRISQFYVGTFMSSLGSQGFSISVLKVNSEDVLKFLNAPTSAPGWVRTEIEDFMTDSGDLPITEKSSCAHDLLNKAKYQNISVGSALTEKACTALKQILLFAAEALISCEIQLNIIDAEAGDGDAGTVLKRAAEAIKESVIDNLVDLTNPAKLLLQLSEICCDSMGGLSGALYSMFFKSASKTFQGCDEITPAVCSKAFKEAVKSLKCFGNVELGDRTILDALWPAAESFEAALKHEKHFSEAVYLAAATCEFKSEETKYIKPSTIQHVDIHPPVNYADAGAHAASIWLRAISEGLKLHYPLESFDSETPSRRPGIFAWKFLNEEETNYLTENDLPCHELLQFFEEKIGTDEYLLSILLMETLKYCRDNLKNSKKTSALLGTVYFTHQYFTASRWRAAAEVYFYFRESILLQSVESPPKSMEIFEPDEAKNAIIFFVETYLRNLPIISILHLPHYKLHLKLPRANTLKFEALLEKEMNQSLLS